MNLDVSHGDIFYINLSYDEGIEDRGIKPVIIISNNFMNRNSTIVQIVPLTSKVTRWTLPTHIKVEKKEMEFSEKDLVILTERIMAVEKSRLLQKIGIVKRDLMDKIMGALILSLLPNEQAKQLSPIQGTFFLEETVRFEEDYEYEFKDFSKSNNPSKTIIDTIEQYASGFLNSENGGRVLYGISNNGKVIGLKLRSEQKDVLNRGIQGNLQNLKPPIDPTVYKIVYHEVYDENEEIIIDLYVFEFYIPPYFDKTVMHFTHNGEAYAKVSGVNQKLDILQVQDWIKRRVTEELQCKI